MNIPEVLAGGNHDQIRSWRRRKALEKTVRTRPDLIDEAKMGPEDRKILAEVRRELGQKA